MADYTQYPTVNDVEILLKSTTYWPADSTQAAYAREQAQVAIDGAIDEFENRTGWFPFLADTVTTEDFFAASDFNGYLEFDAGAVEITEVKVNGSLYEKGVQWWPMPSNALRKKKPYTGIQFNSSVFGWATWKKPARISVTARWGYCSTMRRDAWLAIMRLAAVQTLGQIENAQGTASISQDGFSKGFDVVGVITQKDLLDVLGKRFENIVAEYTRVVC